MVLQGGQQKTVNAIIRTLEDTTASEIVAITSHAVHFSQLVVDDLEKKHLRLKDMHVSLNENYNKLFIENCALKEQMKKVTTDSLGGIRLEELEKMNKELQQVKDEAKNNYFEIRKASLLKVANKVIEKLSEVHTSYSLTSQLLRQLEEILSFFQPISANWMPKVRRLRTNQVGPTGQPTLRSPWSLPATNNDGSGSPLVGRPFRQPRQAPLRPGRTASAPPSSAPPGQHSTQPGPHHLHPARAPPPPGPPPTPPL
ncbi:uncharacterized protein LOC131873977 [Cryptomeria japonica]|uniref:uncharacterized protein LOC131873977 n=1 Tax=Cryptomeria japonica TaxID=3369 RepID=UPI0027DA96EA|nr:uncharacterized protein LOC131873977 [Cryptomeria japonica]